MNPGATLRSAITPLAIMLAMASFGACGTKHNDNDALPDSSQDSTGKLGATDPSLEVLSIESSLAPGTTGQGCIIDLHQDAIVNPINGVRQALFSGKIPDHFTCAQQYNVLALYISSAATIKVDEKYNCVLVAKGKPLRCVSPLISLAGDGTFNMTISGPSVDSVGIEMKLVYEKDPSITASK